MPLDAETIKQCSTQVNLWLPAATFVAGLFATRFTMSKSERFNANQAKFTLTKEMAKARHEAYLELKSALHLYAEQAGKPTLQDFLEISGKAQTYLYQQKLIADAILSDKLDTVSRDETLIPSLCETANKTIPSVYKTLKSIADKNGLPYPDEFERSNYMSIFSAIERYAPSSALMPPAANNPSTDATPRQP